MTKLDEIKQALADYEATWAKVPDYPDDDYDLEQAYFEARNNLISNAPDYLRALVAVVDAAAEYKTAVVNDESSDALWKWQANLFEVLKALE